MRQRAKQFERTIRAARDPLRARAACKFGAVSQSWFFSLGICRVAFGKLRRFLHETALLGISVLILHCRTIKKASIWKKRKRPFGRQARGENNKLKKSGV